MTKKKKLKKKNILIIVVAVLILLIITIVFFALKKDNKELNDVNNKTEEKEKEKVTIIDESSKSRPIAFTIDNSDDARKLHSGIQDAYMVYEMINYADGRTRFLAFYKDSNTSKIGPVRSVRHYHLDYVLENDAILAHWGQSTIAASNLSSLKINHINGITYGSNKTEDKIENNRYFWTDTNKNVDISHRRFTSIDLINKGIDKLKFEKNTDVNNLFKYSTEEINLKEKDDSKIANVIEIYYSNTNYVTYEYDNKSNSYLRSVKGSKHIDNNTNEQIKVKNIISYQVNNYTISGNSDILQELENVGKGEGYYITNGYATKIKWQKDCHECQTKYTYMNGDEVILNDGNTFIQISPTSKDVNIS